tara:strand:- start:1063 stop:1917 length:855 start_codon:yes stop_codon:yes gene_type:complete
MTKMKEINFTEKKFQKIIKDFNLKGYAKIGKIMTSRYNKELLKRVEDLMMGKITYKNMFFKLDDPKGNYFKIKHEDVKNEIFSGPSERYKKIKDLEYDPKFLRLMQSKIIRKISKELIGKEASSMRAMILNKSYINSSILPFHQDVSENWAMSSKPTFTLWLSLNGANKKNGCLKVVEGSHRFGVIGNGNNLFDKKLKKRFLIKNKIKYLNCKPGEAFIFSNYTLHGSDKNLTKRNRVAFTLCLMDANITNLKTNKQYPKIFGKKSLTINYIKSLKEIPKKVYA